MTLPKKVKDAHLRAFPDRAFYPSAIRPQNTAVMDALFLNEIFGTQPPPLDPTLISETIGADILQGDKVSIDRAMDVLNLVAFDRSKARTRATLVLQITHPLIGRDFKPWKTPNFNLWARFFIRHTSLGEQARTQLERIATRATERPVNLLERAVLDAIQINRTRNLAPVSDEEGEAERAPAPDAEGGRSAIPWVNEEFSRLVKNRIAAYNRSPMGPSDAEDAIRDAMTLFEVFWWIYWVQMHASARESILRFKAGGTPTPALRSWDFGYETERAAASGRPFTRTGKLLETALYEGSIALNALVALHQALDLAEAVWFDDLPTLRRLNTQENVAAMTAWNANYCALVGDVRQPPIPPKDLGEAMSQTYELIREHYENVESETDRYPKAVGYGVARSLGSSRRFTLLSEIRANQVAGLVDIDLILLIGRCLNTDQNRVRLKTILGEFQRLGIDFDEYTTREIERDLTARGLIQSLSDSGEAKYVRI